MVKKNVSDFTYPDGKETAVSVWHTGKQMDQKREKTNRKHQVAQAGRKANIKKENHTDCLQVQLNISYFLVPLVTEAWCFIDTLSWKVSNFAIKSSESLLLRETI